ncbi:MAG: gliding motility-associated C-terminal domain-containing protein, partial [Bacteroidales bacterium]|nr:gliding motility-associated C-terminal domain-containing protein [Bacteroidales bacterium]
RTYASAEKMEYCFTVDPNNAGFGYKYSCLMENPAHTWVQQPYFEAYLYRKSTGDTVQCGHYIHWPGDGKSPFYYFGKSTDIQANTGWCFTPWTDVITDLSGFAGQQVCVVFRVKDCNGDNSIPSIPQYGEHGAYAYIDTYCIPMKIEYPEFCGTSGSIQICAPTGYQSYTWAPGQPGMVPPLNQRCATVNNPVSGTTYTVTMISYSGCPVVRTVKINGIPLLTSRDTMLCPNEGPITISAVVSNSVNPPYTYTWSTGAQTTAITVNPPTSTTYIVTVSNSTGCTATQAIVVGRKNCAPAVVVNNATVCAGTCATLNATGSGGTTPYTYSWSPSTGLSGTSGATVTACPATTTTYILTLKDNLSATATAQSVVTVNPLPNITATGGTICLGASINISASGGISYTWNTGSISNPLNVSPNTTTTYTVTGINVGGCTNTASCVVFVNPLPTISAAGGTVCNGSSTIISATGGTNYTWNNGLGTGQSKTVTPNITTTYFVTGTDANGCTGTASCVVIVNNNIIPTVNNPVICNGTCATLTVSGGNNYTWSPGGQTTQSISVCPATTTTYFVNATNTLGCTGTVVATVTVNPLPNITATGGTICSGANINISANGAGTGTYLWDNGLGNGQTKNVTPNITTTYNVTGTDANGCTGTASCIVTVNPLPVITANGGTVCNGSSTVISVTGGVSYTWNNSVQSSSQTVSPIVNTTYYVSGTDANGCTGTSSCMVVVNTSISPVTNNPTICNGTIATLTVSGGDFYTWFTTPNQTTSSITVNPANTTTYFVSASNTFGCTGTVVATVNVNPLPNITAIGGTICLGGNINISANGAGTGTYLWDNGLGTGQSKNVSPNVTTIYNVTGTDANGCTSIASCMVTVNPLPNVTATGGTMCENTFMTVSASGATTYNWDNGLGAGNPKTVSPNKTTTYTVTGTDNNTCSNTASCVVCVTSALILNVTPSEVCNGSPATVCVSNGTSYTWDTGENTSCITVSPVSTTSYYVTGINSNGCTGVSFAVVNVNQLPSVSATNKTICYGTTTTLTAVGNGGTAPYNYQWASGTNPATGATVSVNPIVNTTYSITVTDNKGCTATTTVSVIVSPQMLASIIKTDAKCGLPNASATVTASGGIPIPTGPPNYTYHWNNSSNTDVISNIVSGPYTVTVTDAVGCIVTASTTILDTPPVTLTTSQTPTNCFPNGTATVNVAPGTPTYTYTWSTVPPQNTPVATNIDSGPYSVTVIDSKGCSAIANVTVLVNNPLTVTTSSTPEHCDHKDGIATVNPTGGIPALGPYTYLWDNGRTTKIIDSLIQGSYLVTVTYGNCTKPGAATVSEKSGPQADFTFTPSVLDIFENTTALLDDLSSPGGQPIIQWHWNFGDNNATADIRTPIHTFTAVGNYLVCLSVTDSEDCVDSICKPIIVKDIFTIYIPNAFSPNRDLLNDGFIPQGYRIDPANFTMTIFDRWGEEIYKTNDLNSPWNGRYHNTGELVQIGVYVYRVIVKELEGPRHEFIGRVSVVR